MALNWIRFESAGKIAGIVILSFILLPIQGIAGNSNPPQASQESSQNPENTDGSQQDTAHSPGKKSASFARNASDHSSDWAFLQGSQDIDPKALVWFEKPQEEGESMFVRGMADVYNAAEDTAADFARYMRESMLRMIPGYPSTNKSVQDTSRPQKDGSRAESVQPPGHDPITGESLAPSSPGSAALSPPAFMETASNSNPQNVPMTSSPLPQAWSFLPDYHPKNPTTSALTDPSVNLQPQDSSFPAGFKTLTKGAEAVRESSGEAIRNFMLSVIPGYPSPNKSSRDASPSENVQSPEYLGGGIYGTMKYERAGKSLEDGTSKFRPIEDHLSEGNQDVPKKDSRSLPADSSTQQTAPSPSKPAESKGRAPIDERPNLPQGPKVLLQQAPLQKPEKGPLDKTTDLLDETQREIDRAVGEFMNDPSQAAAQVWDWMLEKSGEFHQAVNQFWGIEYDQNGNIINNPYPALVIGDGWPYFEMGEQNSSSQGGKSSGGGASRDFGSFEATGVGLGQGTNTQVQTGGLRKGITIIIRDPFPNISEAIDQFIKVTHENGQINITIDTNTFNKAIEDVKNAVEIHYDLYSPDGDFPTPSEFGPNRTALRSRGSLHNVSVLVSQQTRASSQSTSQGSSCNT